MIWHWTSLDLTKILLCVMLTLLKNMNHLSHMQIYFAVACAVFFFFLEGTSVGCSNPQTHKPPEWKHKDGLVCADKGQNERRPGNLPSSLLPLSFSLYCFFFSHHFCLLLISFPPYSQFQRRSNSAGVCWHSSLHYAIQGWFCCRKFNARFDAFIFTSAAKISLSLNLWMPNIPKSAAALNPPEGCFFYVTGIKHFIQPDASATAATSRWPWPTKPFTMWSGAAECQSTSRRHKRDTSLYLRLNFL